MTTAGEDGAVRPPARVARIVRALRRIYADADCALDHSDALQLLVATILSAQCTDERVNRVTPALFQRFPDAAAYAVADPAELEQIIHSTGFFRNKARSLIGLGAALAEQHGGRVPSRMEQLVELPGVGRKTANVVLGTWFEQPAIFVDTHVARLAGRLGWTGSARPGEDRVRPAGDPSARGLDLHRACVDLARAPRLQGAQAGLCLLRAAPRLPPPHRLTLTLTAVTTSERCRRTRLGELSICPWARDAARVPWSPRGESGPTSVRRARACAGARVFGPPRIVPAQVLAWPEVETRSEEIMELGLR